MSLPTTEADGKLTLGKTKSAGKKLNGGGILERIWELDFIRGICILLMILDHAFYDLAYIFRYTWAESFFAWPVRNIIWWVAVFCFVAISGISSTLSRSNFVRGTQLALVAILLSLVTWLMDKLTGQENVYIVRFGILHMLATCMLFYALIKNKDLVSRSVFSLVASAVGIVFNVRPLKAPFFLLAVFVKSTGGFYSSDYFPLLPWLGFFVFGSVVGSFFYDDRKSLKPLKKTNSLIKTILFVGRHSLIFYVLHQPVIYAVLWLLQ